jgi:hypothetical protein
LYLEEIETGTKEKFTKGIEFLRHENSLVSSKRDESTPKEEFDSDEFDLDAEETKQNSRKKSLSTSNHSDHSSELSSSSEFLTQTQKDSLILMWKGIRMIVHHAIRPKNEFTFWIPKSCDRLVWSKNADHKSKAKGILLLIDIKRITAESGRNLLIVNDTVGNMHVEAKSDSDLRYFTCAYSLLKSNADAAKSFAVTLHSARKDSSYYMAEEEDLNDDSEMLSV